MEEFRKRMMQASIQELASTARFLTMAFSDKEFAEKSVKLEILKQVIHERGLDK